MSTMPMITSGGSISRVRPCRSPRSGSRRSIDATRGSRCRTRGGRGRGILAASRFCLLVVESRLLPPDALVPAVVGAHRHMCQQAPEVSDNHGLVGQPGLDQQGVDERQAEDHQPHERPCSGIGLEAPADPEGRDDEPSGPKGEDDPPDEGLEPAVLLVEQGHEGPEPAADQQQAEPGFGVMHVSPICKERACSPSSRLVCWEVLPQTNSLKL